MWGKIVVLAKGPREMESGILWILSEKERMKIGDKLRRFKMGISAKISRENEEEAHWSFIVLGIENFVKEWSQIEMGCKQKKTRENSKDRCETQGTEGPLGKRSNSGIIRLWR